MGIHRADSMSLYGSVADVLASHWTSVAAAAYLGSGGRFGGGALRLGSTAHHLRDTSFTPAAEIYTAFQIKPEGASWPGGRIQILGLTQGGAQQVQLELDSAGFLRAYRRNRHLATATSPLTLNAYAHVGVHTIIHPTAGVFDVQVEGQPVISFTGQTRDTLSSTVDRVDIMGAAAPTFLVHDVIVGTAMSFPSGGVPKVRVQLPDEDSAELQWTPRSGAANHFGEVDDGVAGPDGDASYIDGAAGQRERLILADPPAGSATVLAVQAVAFGKKTAGADRGLKLGVEVAGSENQGNSVNLSESYRSIRHMVLLNPNTGLPFNRSDALELTLEPA